MTDYMQAASAVLASAQRRVEIAAQNISNMNTPGYRRRVSFEQALAAAGADAGLPSVVTSTDLQQGKPVNTGAPLDLAIGGNGFFVVRDGDQSLYTRNGQFHRDQDGRITTLAGLPLQLLAGGDLVLKDGVVKVSADGTVTEDDRPMGRLALAQFGDAAQAVAMDGGVYRSPADNVIDAKGATVSQGMLESSNVSLGEEMVSIMQSLRGAEAGQKLVNVYDDLLGRAISTFGQAT